MRRVNNRIHRFMMAVAVALAATGTAPAYAELPRAHERFVTVPDWAIVHTTPLDEVVAVGPRAALRARVVRSMSAVVEAPQRPPRGRAVRLVASQDAGTLPATLRAEVAEAVRTPPPSNRVRVVADLQDGRIIIQLGDTMHPIALTIRGSATPEATARAVESTCRYALEAVERWEPPRSLELDVTASTLAVEHADGSRQIIDRDRLLETPPPGSMTERASPPRPARGV